LAGEIEVLGGKLPQGYFFHHKSHMVRPGLEPGRRGRKPETNPPELWHGLSYGVIEGLSRNLPGKTEEIRGKPLRITAVPAEMQTERL
jgi:hypothetical protein